MARTCRPSASASGRTPACRPHGPGVQGSHLQLLHEVHGIPINFGIAVALGFLIGTAIAGQTFYNFTLENLRYFGTLKAMAQPTGCSAHDRAPGPGGGRHRVRPGRRRGIPFRYLMRVNGACLPATLDLLYLSAGAITVICVISALISIHKVMRLEPAIVFKG